MKEKRLGYGHINDEEVSYSNGKRTVVFVHTQDKKRLSIFYETKGKMVDWINLNKEDALSLGAKIMNMGKEMREEDKKEK